VFAVLVLVGAAVYFRFAKGTKIATASQTKLDPKKKKTEETKELTEEQKKAL
jgi:hypothetical protein